MWLLAVWTVSFSVFGSILFFFQPVYMCSNGTHNEISYNQLIVRVCLASYSELPLIWTPEMWPPLYSDHFERSPTTNSIQVPPYNETTSLIRTL